MSEPVTTAAGTSALLQYGLPVAGQLLNSALGGLFGSSGAHYERRNMREAARLQHEENVYWAAYNTPFNQMKRLREAGLNPNLVYGNGADAQFQGHVSPSGSAPSFRSPSDFGGLATDFLNLQIGNEQLKGIQKDNQIKEIERQDKQFDLNKKMSYGGPQFQGWFQRKQDESNYRQSLNKEELQRYDVSLKEIERQASMLNYDLMWRTQDDRVAFEHWRKENMMNENLAKELANGVYLEQVSADLFMKRAQAQDFIAQAAMLGELREYYKQLQKVGASQEKLNEVEGRIREAQVLIEQSNAKVLRHTETARKLQEWTKIIGNIVGSAASAASAFYLGGKFNQMRTPQPAPVSVGGFGSY